MFWKLEFRVETNPFTEKSPLYPRRFIILELRSDCVCISARLAILDYRNKLLGILRNYILFSRSSKGITSCLGFRHISQNTFLSFTKNSVFRC